MPWFIKLAFAGLGNMIWHWGLGIGAIIILLLVEFFTAQIVSFLPILDKPLNAIRKDLLWVAVGIALVLAGEYIGASDMAKRNEAQQEVVTEQVDEAVRDAVKSPGLDKWDTNK